MLHLLNNFVLSVTTKEEIIKKKIADVYVRYNF